ncbi:MAG: peptide deformylase [Patescibacteria group bacterium]|nr:peptide deformylase [Patescibacteria group bacterium]
MKRKIILYPDEILTKKTKKVEVIDKRIKDLIKEMKKVMTLNNGVGLAANQIGEDLSIFVALHNDEILEFINPRIISVQGNEQVMEEGCLSLPKIWGRIKRYPIVNFEYQDMWGKRKKKRVKDLLAQIVQHEIDHLEGKLFIDKANEIFRLEEKVE